jgi:hypothetical protein
MLFIARHTAARKSDYSKAADSMGQLQQGSRIPNSRYLRRRRQGDTHRRQKMMRVERIF